MDYEWSVAKREYNLHDRGLDFADAPRLFEGLVLQWTRLPQEYPELRVMAVGMIEGDTFAVVYTQLTPTRRRIISFRRASRKERLLYAQAFPASRE